MNHRSSTSTLGITMIANAMNCAVLRAAPASPDRRHRIVAPQFNGQAATAKKATSVKVKTYVVTVANGEVKVKRSG